MQKPAEDTRSVRLLRGSERNAYKDKNKKAHAQKLSIKLKKKKLGLEGGIHNALVTKLQSVGGIIIAGDNTPTTLGWVTMESDSR